MSELWTKIYDEVITYEKDWTEMSRCAEKGVARLFQKNLEDQEDDKVELARDDVMIVVDDAVCGGFYLGMKYGFRLCMEMMEK